ncbi:hypothetical protein JQN58_28960 [Aneurinibacillus sp. BA2021]|uniref:hypothetical protein n=1 Tax=Microbacterium sp. PF5 TaxID=2305435 RepID=UPI00109BEAEC|nr:hypothetical protein [Microbacterium sp. PF5]MBN6190892.1 hypothetical protein [Aneurinibacillus sp. BA2021]
MTRRHGPAWSRRWRRGAPEETVRALADALEARDELAIRDVMHRAVTLVVDSGGHGQTASLPLAGRAAAAAELAAVMTAGTSVAAASINGAPGITLARDGRVVGVLTAEVTAGRLVTVWLVCNPDKLRHWNR